MLKIMSFLLDMWAQGASRDLLITSKSKLKILASSSDKNFGIIFRSHFYIRKDTHSALWARPWERSWKYQGWLHPCLMCSSGSAYDWIRRGAILRTRRRKKIRQWHDKVYSFLCSTFPKPRPNTEITDNYRYREDPKRLQNIKNKPNRLHTK